VRSFYAWSRAAEGFIVASVICRDRIVGLFALAASTGIACNSETATPVSAPLVFEGSPAETMASVSGNLQIGVWWSPLQPVVGYDATQFAISDATGAPVSGLTLTIVPWMPAHGHGASVQPTVTETAPGIYAATPLDFFMAGEWELRTSIASGVDGGGAGDAAIVADTFDPTINVP
jgi:YtkA-like